MTKKEMFAGMLMIFEVHVNMLKTGPYKELIVTKETENILIEAQAMLENWEERNE